MTDTAASTDSHTKPTSTQKSVEDVADAADSQTSSTAYTVSMSKLARPVRTRDRDQFQTTRKAKSLARTCRSTQTISDGINTVSFRCSMPNKHEGSHMEVGRVRDVDGNISIYTHAWRNIELEVWRDAYVNNPYTD